MARDKDDKPSENKNVVALPGVAPPAPGTAAVTDVVKLLDHLLALAKKGELRALAFAAVKSGGVVSTGRAMLPRERNDLTAAIGDLFHAIHVERGDEFVEVKEQADG